MDKIEQLKEKHYSQILEEHLNSYDKRAEDHSNISIQFAIEQLEHYKCFLKENPIILTCKDFEQKINELKSKIQ